MHAQVPVSVHLFQVFPDLGYSVLSVTPFRPRPPPPLMFRPAGEWVPAAGREPLVPSWGQQRTRLRYTGLYHSRCWCSWRRAPWCISVHSHHTGTELHSSSRTSSLVERLWEKGGGFVYVHAVMMGRWTNKSMETKKCHNNFNFKSSLIPSVSAWMFSLEITFQNVGVVLYWGLYWVALWVVWSLNVKPTGV